MDIIDYLEIYEFKEKFEFRLYAIDPSKWFNMNSPLSITYSSMLKQSGHDDYLNIKFEMISPGKYKVTDICSHLFPDTKILFEDYKYANEHKPDPDGRYMKEAGAKNNIFVVASNKSEFLAMFKVNLDKAKEYCKNKSNYFGGPISYKVAGKVVDALIEACDNYQANFQSLLKHLGY